MFPDIDMFPDMFQHYMFPDTDMFPDMFPDTDMFPYYMFPDTDMFPDMFPGLYLLNLIASDRTMVFSLRRLELPLPRSCQIRLQKLRYPRGTSQHIVFKGDLLNP